MVALQILVLSVKVRILMGQQELLVINFSPAFSGAFYLQDCCSLANPLGQQELLVSNFSPAFGGTFYLKNRCSLGNPLGQQKLLVINLDPAKWGLSFYKTTVRLLHRDRLS